MTNNRWKAAFLIVCLALAVDDRGIAQVTSSDGLIRPPQNVVADKANSESASEQSAESFLNSLDPEGERLKKHRDAALKRRKAAASGKNAPSTGSNRAWSAWALGLSETTMLGIMALIGVLSSLTAVGYVWWVRTQRARNPAGVFLNVVRDSKDGNRRDTPELKPASKRRAA